MTQAASAAVATNRILNDLMRDDRGRLLSALISRVKSFQLAEDALQDAMASAVEHWSRNGPPHSPKAWLLQVAWRKALDRIRRGKTADAGNAALRHLIGEEFGEEPNDIPDERLRLIFTCCHPALEPKSRVALTLHAICGLTTSEVAAAFLDHETTMGQRLSRAKTKIAKAGIAYEVPEADDWTERLQAVLAVIYLVYNAGYSKAQEATRDLEGEGIFLSRLLDELCPRQPEVQGCLALMLLTQARRAARTGNDGVTIPLAQQDRTLWDSAMITEGLGLLDEAIARRNPGPYQIKAAIAACHLQPGGSDWHQIVALYDSLLRFEPTPVVLLNRTIAVAEAGEPEIALQLLGTLSADLANYQPFHAAHAHLLRRTGNYAAARQAFEKAIELSPSPADAMYLRRQRDSL